MILSLALTAEKSFAAGDLRCHSVFEPQETRVDLNVHWGLEDSQLNEMAADVQSAIDFSRGHFSLPGEVSFNAAARNSSFDVPHYDPSSDRILYIYQFGKMREGQFISKSRRHSRDIFFHEFGHLIFRHNVGTDEEWIAFYRENRNRKLREGSSFREVYEKNLKATVTAYNELFADIFAVAISQNPRAMYSGEFFTLKESDLSGHFRAPPKQVMQARDFLREMDVHQWTESEPHVALGPVRSAFKDDPYAADLLRNDPARLARVALDAIRFELKKLFSDDIEAFGNYTVPQFNQRMIDTLKEFLEREKASPKT